MPLASPLFFPLPAGVAVVSEPSFLVPMVAFSNKFAGEALHFMCIYQSCKVYHVLQQILTAGWALKKKLSLELLLSPLKDPCRGGRCL